MRGNGLAARCRKCDKLLSSENSRQRGLCAPCERTVVVRCSRCGNLLRQTAAKVVGLCPSCFRRFREARRLRLEHLRMGAFAAKRRTRLKLQRSQRSQAADVVYHIVVPRYLVEELGLAKGDVLRVRTEGTRLIYERD